MKRIIALAYHITTTLTPNCATHGPMKHAQAPISLPLQTRQNIHVESALERRQLQPGEIHSATNPIADARMVFGSCVSMKSICGL